MPEIHNPATTKAVPAGTLNRRQLLSFAPSTQPERKQEVTRDYWIRISRSAMACKFEAVIASEAEQSVSAGQEFLDEIDRLEFILTVYRPTSEVSRLNREAAVNPISVGPELFDLLQLCDRLQKDTEGAFDITTGALSECWGFQDRQPVLPAAEALRAARERVGSQNISLGANRAVSFHSPGVRINFGGVGKGYALDCGASKIRSRGIETALLNAGFSSILALGAGADGSGWLVGLRHPIYKNQRLGTVRLHSCAVGTSGQEEQSFEKDGQQYGHILDPRTGFPSNKVVSVSVIADSAARADALATAFFVGGPELAERYCAKHDGVIAVMLLAHDLSCPIVIGSSDQAEVELSND